MQLANDSWLRNLWPKALAIFVFALALWAQTDALAGVFYDDGIYLSLAKSLAEGDGFSYGHLPGDPAGVRYPFLYPFILSRLWIMWPSFPENLTLFSLFDSAALGVAAFLIARHGRRLGLSDIFTAVALLAGFAAFPLLAMVGVRFSEPMFLALFAGAFLVADSGEPSGRRALASGLLAGLAALTRSLGVAAIIGISLGYLYRNARKPALISLSVGLLILVPWAMWVSSNAGGLDPRLTSVYGTYWEGAGRMGPIEFLAGASGQVFSPVARLLLPALPGSVWLVLALTIAGLTLWGGYRGFSKAPALIASLALYAGVVTVWPYTPDRFVWIVLPWVLMLMSVGGWDLWRRGRYWRAVPVLVAAAVLFGYVPRNLNSLTHRGFAATAEGISQPFRLLVASVSLELPADAVIASADEALIALYTGRDAVPSHLSFLDGRVENPLSASQSLDFFCETGVTHIALSGHGAPAAAVVDQLVRDSTEPVQPLFAVTNGPALYTVRCRD